MREPMVICVIGLQDSGKTTLAEQMVRRWTEHGLCVATIKHDGHAGHVAGAGAAGDAGDAGHIAGAGESDDWEKPGSDTRRLADAGAAFTMVCGGGQTLLRTVRDSDAADVRALCGRLVDLAERQGNGLDAIVIEGFKRSSLPKVAVARNVVQLDWIRNERFSNLAAVVCPSAIRSLADADWALYHETDVMRLCADLWASRPQNIP